MAIRSAAAGFILALILAGAVAGWQARQSGPPMPGRWQPTTSAPIARVEAPGIVVDDRLFVFGGFTGLQLDALQRVDVFDPQTETWSEAPPLPTAVTHIVAAQRGREIWIAGGFVGHNPGVITDQVWIYDIDLQRWREGPRLPAPRAGGALVRRADSLHYFGGLKDRNTDAGDHWEIASDNGATWQSRAPLPTARNHLSGVTVEGRIFALGGQLRHDIDREDVALCDVYDAANDRWQPIAPLPKPRSHFETATIVHNGKIVIFGGRSDRPRSFFSHRKTRADLALADVDEYDPVANRWRALPGLPAGLLGPTVGRVGDRFVVTGGSLFLSGFSQNDTLIGKYPFSFHEQ